MSSEPTPFTPDPYERPRTVPDEVLRSGLSRRGMLRALGLLGGAAVVGAGSERPPPPLPPPQPGRPRPGRLTPMRCRRASRGTSPTSSGS
ncbi:twin-arginine translocation signal domain-containing protein [Microbacterium panaciterrae]|uniref:twin-arginine translocation signal domain-containing protein n=1 Tax=Microbacterium panaciterrae TaxID=985759 RepID=UPI003CD0B5E2